MAFSVLPEDIQPEALEKPFSLFRENALRLLECCQDEFEKVFYRTLIDGQKRRSIACFTESNDNSAMWGHYADSHRGFCIEYDFQKILTACSEKCADVQHCTSLMMSPVIAPMIYMMHPRSSCRCCFLVWRIWRILQSNHFMKTFW